MILLLEITSYLEVQPQLQWTNLSKLRLTLMESQFLSPTLRLFLIFWISYTFRGINAQRGNLQLVNKSATSCPQNRQLEIILFTEIPQK